MKVGFEGGIRTLKLYPISWSLIRKTNPPIKWTIQKPMEIFLERIVLGCPCPIFRYERSSLFFFWLLLNSDIFNANYIFFLMSVWKCKRLSYFLYFKITHIIKYIIIEMIAFGEETQASQLNLYINYKQLYILVS